MASPLFYGWKIVVVCFLIALFGWGMGFYGPGIYLASLKTHHGWSTTLISSGITMYYLMSATMILFIGDVFKRFGPRRVVLVGIMAMGLGVFSLTMITTSWQLYLCFLSMAVGWATMSIAAINTLLAPWFERKRGLAISLALNGASCGGIMVAPLIIWLISRYAFALGVSIAVGIMLVVLVPSIMVFLYRHPHDLGLWPDGETPREHDQADRSVSTALGASPWRVSIALRSLNFWTITVPFALGLAAQVGFLTHQISYLGPLLGTNGAGVAVSLTTAAAVMGRLITGVYIDRLDRRWVAALTFGIQALSIGAMMVFPSRPVLYIACVGIGLGVGNLISLPGLIVQQEFPAEHFGKIVSLIVACTQYTFAFGPGVMGVIRDVTGGYAVPLMLCILLEGLAAGIVLLRSVGGQQRPSQSRHMTLGLTGSHASAQ